VINALTIDVEDYYHVSAFESAIRCGDWERWPSRIERNTQRILGILDHANVHATFFVLGWIAERFPELVKTIHSQGHEIGSHGRMHRMIQNLSQDEFAEDLAASMRSIEAITGEPVRLYRAPSFSITPRTLWAIDLLRDAGIRCDSSVFPIHHDRYGFPQAPLNPYQIAPDMWEFPMTVLDKWGVRLPAGGGGYLRIYPYSLTRWALSNVNDSGRPVIVYVHPWELDSDQPRVSVSLTRRFRHYYNLGRTEERLRYLLGDFTFGPLSQALQGWRSQNAC
jgi:polysaccharide deacetylase family protein (PEP-CTERM system associated)